MFPDFLAYTNVEIGLVPVADAFAGGVNTMRGFKRRRLGPLDAAGDPLGGDRIALASTELRIPLPGPFGGALFADGGRVSTKGIDHLADQWRTAVGCGLLLATPVGPFRVDLAINTDDPPAEQPRRVFHLSIGHPY